MKFIQYLRFCANESENGIVETRASFIVFGSNEVIFYLSASNKNEAIYWFYYSVTEFVCNMMLLIDEPPVLNDGSLFSDFWKPILTVQEDDFKRGHNQA